MKKNNIVFVGLLSGFGGAEKSMIMIANGLAKLGHSITIISLKNNEIVYNIDEKVKYIFIPDTNGMKIQRQWNRLLNLKQKLHEIKPDLVISFWFQLAVFATMLSNVVGYKTIYAERGDPSDKEYNGALGILRKIFFKNIDGFIFQTQGAKMFFSEKIQKKSTVINNPVYINYSEYKVPTKRRKVIVNVGRLHEQKNQKLLIDSFSKIHHMFPEYKLEIYGDGQLKSNLDEYIKKLNLSHKVILKGTTNKLFDEIVDSSLFVLSSDYEGMPNALMEAMALGIPCISTDCKPGGARELITDGKNGILTPIDSTDELTKAIKFMLENPNEAESMGERGKDICKTHSKETIFQKWNEYIVQILN